MYSVLKYDWMPFHIQLSLRCNGLNLFKVVSAFSMKSRRCSGSWQQLPDTDGLCFKVISEQAGFACVLMGPPLPNSELTYQSVLL